MMSLLAALAAIPLPTAHLRAVPFSQVQIEDRFWAPRQKTNRDVSIAHSLEMLKKFGYVRNFELAAQRKTEGFEGLVFVDSDAYKVLESASYALAMKRDPILERQVDQLIEKLAAAQAPDGYLNTYFQVKEPGKRWTNLRDLHELYCAGHLFEAAVAHYQATGKKTLLNVATKYADHIDSVFGDGPGKRAGYCGHPEIELALFKLYQATGQKHYLDLGRFFLIHRGEHFFAREHGVSEARYDGEYWQDDVPIGEHRRIKGHAVRAAYLMSGAVDIGGATRDEKLLDMVDRVWRNTDERNTYVTGGIGPSAHNEGFTVDYDLPNLTAYQETCASVSLAMWNHRLSLLYGNAKYADRMERALYNGVLAGVSLTGDRFFYVNPLASRGAHHRSEWFACACCPPNVTRTLAALGNYAYATGPGALYANLYIQGKATAEIDGKPFGWSVQTNYPWDGNVKFTIQSPGKVDLRLRIPEWALGATARINGQTLAKLDMARGYLNVSRTWKAGDTVDLVLPMPIRRIVADPRVKGNDGLAAFARGPLVYCLEGVDQKAPLDQMWIPAETPLTTQWQSDLLGGVAVFKGQGKLQDTSWAGGLYQTMRPAKTVPFTAVPYYAWDNRQGGEMQVWMPLAPKPATVRTLAGSAAVTVSFLSGNAQPWGIHDGAEVKKSSEQPVANCHWWPHKGTSEWVQYAWTKPVTLNASSVFWFDDTGRGECRLPASWRILYLRGSQWVPVEVKGDSYPIQLDGWCRVEFAPIETKALRLEVKLKEGWAAGVHEWKVESPDDN